MPKFTKNERLCNQAMIESLFEKGQSFYISPFKVLWQQTDENLHYPAQILISVPRKAIRHAIRRNLMRRRIREIYRKNKEEFYARLLALNSKCLFALIYSGRELMPSSAVEPKIIVILQRLIQENDKAIG